MIVLDKYSYIAHIIDSKSVNLLSEYYIVMISIHSQILGSRINNKNFLLDGLEFFWYT